MLNHVLKMEWQKQNKRKKNINNFKWILKKIKKRKNTDHMEEMVWHL